MEVIVIVLAAVVAIVVGAHVARRRRWERAALRLGLELEHGGLFGTPSIAGTIGGCKTLVRLVPASRAGAHESPSRSYDTFFRMTFPWPLPTDVHFSPAGSREGAKVSVGLRPIATGDEMFDDIVLTRGRSEAGVRRFLTPARRKALACFLGARRGLRYVDASVIVSREGGRLREAAIVATVRELEQLACCLARSGDETALEEPHPPPLGAETAAAPETPAPAVPVAESIAEETAPAPEETVPAAAPEAAEPACADDASPTCATLFAPKLSTYDTQRVFEREYRGKDVLWQGTLTAVERSSYDPELGEEPGVKATFEIGAVSSALGDDEPVYAAVRFAPDAVAALESRRGARVAFRGTLAGADGVLRTVYVGDGRLPS